MLSALFLVAILSSAPQARATEVLGARYPALSPDGAAVAFAWHGDIWIVSANGGTARRVTVHVADELRPLFSADGRRLVYASNRYGAFDIFVSDLDGSREKRLTFSSGNDLPTSISADGRYVIFQSNRENGSSIYRVPLAGGRVERLVPGFWNIVSNGIASSVMQ